MNNTTQSVIILALLVVGIQPVMAGTKDDLQTLKAEVKILKEGQVQMQKDLDEIKKLLQAGARAPVPGQQPFTATDMELGEVPYLGELDAPVTMVEFSDYQCPYCRRHATTVMPQLLETYVDTGKVRFVMREFPITNLHARAVATSEAALCAGDQGQYWGMHDLLFGDQKANTDDNLQAFAESLGLDGTAFNKCMDDDRHMAQIRADQSEGQKLGISGTPSFVLGLTDPDDPGKVRLTKFIRGAQPLPTFAAAIDDLIESAEGQE